MHFIINLQVFHRSVGSNLRPEEQEKLEEAIKENEGKKPSITLPEEYLILILLTVEISFKIALDGKEILSTLRHT